MSGDYTKYHGTAEVPKREWVGLTYEEIQEIWTNTFDPVEWDDVQQIAELVSAKLKEKNA